MLFTCLPEGAQIPGRFPGPMHARGKWFTIDIHCHVLTPKAEEMVRSAGLVDWQPRMTFANERTRQVNREQAERNRTQFSSVEKRLEDMDRMGIDIQAITPSPAQTYYSAEPELGIATARVINDNLAEICGKYPDRFVALGTVPFQAPELALAEIDRVHKSLGFRGLPGDLRVHPPHADDVSETAVFRHDRVHPRAAAIPGRAIRRRPRAGRHRLPGRYGRS